MNVGPNPITAPHLTVKESRAGYAVYLITQGQPSHPERDYGLFSREGYQQNPIVYRCIRLISEAALSVPLLVYKGDTPVEKHPFYDLIGYPNPFEGQAEVLDALYSYLLIAGNTFLETVLLGNKPAELYALRPDRMSIKLDNKGRPAEYVYTVNHASVSFKVPAGKKQREILHIKLFNPLNDIYGLSPMDPAAFSIDVFTAAGKFNKALLDNQARPSGALVVSSDKEGDASLTDDQFTRLKSELEERYSGSKNAGRPLLLEGGLDWKEMGTSPQDMEFTQGKAQSAREIALTYGVPPQLLGIPGDNTYSNLKEANVALYRQGVIPFLTRICQALSTFFAPTYGDDFKVWFDVNEIAGLVQEREDTWNRINSSTVLTVNEKRAAIGYDEVEGGDDVLIQSSLVPLAMEEEPEVDDGAALQPEDEDPEDGEGTGTSEGDEVEDEEEPA